MNMQVKLEAQAVIEISNSCSSIFLYVGFETSCKR